MCEYVDFIYLAGLSGGPVKLRASEVRVGLYLVRLGVCNFGGSPSTVDRNSKRCSIDFSVQRDMRKVQILFRSYSYAGWDFFFARRPRSKHLTMYCLSKSVLSWLYQSALLPLANSRTPSGSFTVIHPNPKKSSRIFFAPDKYCNVVPKLYL